jgi:hypothetical protein
MKVYITGDTHGHLDNGKLYSKNFEEGKPLTKDDLVIICGDFGLLWKNIPDKEELYWTKWYNEKPWTTLFIDGNHENHYRLSQLPVVEKFGGKVGIVADSIFHLKRGEIYTINNKTFFCMGGAKSTDDGRLEGVDIWREEIPCYNEMNYAIENLERYNNKVDYIIAHTFPRELIAKLMLALKIDISNIDENEMNNYVDDFTKSMYGRYLDPTARFLSEVCSRVQFEKYFGGHFHVDMIIDKYTMLFDDVIEIL